MLIVMRPDATAAQIDAVCKRCQELGFAGVPIPGRNRTAIGVTGNSGPVPPELFDGLDGVRETIPVTRPYKLVSREAHGEAAVVKAGGVPLGGGAPVVVIAGPCAVESEEQIMRVAEAVRAAGATMLRGGAFKPRTSPYAFQGLREAGLKLLARARERTGLPVVTEAKDTETLGVVAEYADVVQIGARNMQNFSLLEAAGRCGKPVMLKRGMSATIEDLMLAAEYIAASGNQNILLCERGIRTFETSTRNTLDVSFVPVCRALTYLPLVVDPSHGTGIRSAVIPMALAGVAAGADAIMVETHPEPPKALSDGKQSLYLEDMVRLITSVRAIASAIGRTVATPG
ncbi:MAG TPA: 3-deoxy-7-phosphoheptulonate synthase [Myxococcota bacterium]|jgi:3-deoxy-7-phosphoheptulonate synthase|nr:3-deoxy-7-phosphoheptulonate synthase [Myxococcota bacterium]